MTRLHFVCHMKDGPRPVKFMRNFQPEARQRMPRPILTGPITYRVT